MPTINPRLTVTLKPSSAAVLRRLAAAQGDSQGKIVRELLEAFEPILGSLADLMEAANAAGEGVRQQLAKVAAEQEAALSPALALAQATWSFSVDELQRVMETAAGAEPAADPRPVTRGSGTRKTGSARGNENGASDEV